jgi:hypothetical protein
MSLRRHTSAQMGKIAPSFPAALIILGRSTHYAWKGLGLSRAAYTEAAEGIVGYQSSSSLITDDGYDWFTAISFTCTDGSMTIAFPWAQDFKAGDGWRDDRSLALYIEGTVSDQEVGRVLKQIKIKLQQLAREVRRRQMLEAQRRGIHLQVA